jgi:Concanavalin A-like lectin/glucanases superfamily
MPTPTFAEAGTDATQDFSLFAGGYFSPANGSDGTLTSATDQVATGPRAIKFTGPSANAQASAYSPDGACAAAGTRISCRLRFSAVSLSARTSVLQVARSVADGQNFVLGIGFQTGNVLSILGRTNGGTGFQKDGTTALSAGTWYRVALAFVLTSTTDFTIKLYLNGVLEATCTQADGTLKFTAASQIVVGTEINSELGIPATPITTWWMDDIYADNGTDLADPGTTNADSLRVTHKRPNANGTTNGFTTQIGAGGSGYGSGHSPQVNEQALSQTNGWSMIGAGSAVVEEYTIENAATGDVDITGKTIDAVMGWVFAKSLAPETGKIVVDGTQSNIALTSTATGFSQASATPTTYPSGGAAIGIVSATDLTTVSLYECGIHIVYSPTTGRTTKNTRAQPLGMDIGMGWRM